jgi:hypothetical protein
MYGKLAAGLLTLGIAMSTTVSAQAHGAGLLCTDGKTATSFQGGCDPGSRPHARPHRRGHRGVDAAYTLSNTMISSD